MFGIGMQELLIIGVVALLIVGPKKLPELAKTLGKSLSAFRRTADDLTDDLKDAVKDDETGTGEVKSSPETESSELKNESGEAPYYTDYTASPPGGAGSSSEPLTEETANATAPSEETSSEEAANATASPEETDGSQEPDAKINNPEDKWSFP
ncbi:MAG: Sec-independent protein translocase protein TatB [Syntrophobacterales bacterium]|jgi:Tat protein translocase TatB subunit|nr:Sec-independent protein translocase protein TatB [Syntrophobacterales bacterium]